MWIILAGPTEAIDLEYIIEPGIGFFVLHNPGDAPIGTAVTLVPEVLFYTKFLEDLNEMYLASAICRLNGDTSIHFHDQAWWSGEDNSPLAHTGVHGR